MFRIRKAHERGHADHGWLDTWHTFSFADYRDPQHVRFRTLRVMNEDRIAPGQGFGTHPHHDMEIVTYVLSGALEHRDSLGHGEVLRPGEFQRMTAGTGITHSEFNPSPTEPVHLYQIWLFPEQTGLSPSYEQKAFPAAERLDRLRLVASRDAAEKQCRLGVTLICRLSNLPRRSSRNRPFRRRESGLNTALHAQPRFLAVPHCFFEDSEAVARHQSPYRATPARCPRRTGGRRREPPRRPRR